MQDTSVAWPLQHSTVASPAQRGKPWSPQRLTAGSSHCASVGWHRNSRLVHGQVELQSPPRSCAAAVPATSTPPGEDPQDSDAVDLASIAAQLQQRMAALSNHGSRHGQIAAQQAARRSELDAAASAGVSRPASRANSSTAAAGQPSAPWRGSQDALREAAPALFAGFAELREHARRASSAGSLDHVSAAAAAAAAAALVPSGPWPAALTGHSSAEQPPTPLPTDDMPSMMLQQHTRLNQPAPLVEPCVAAHRAGAGSSGGGGAATDSSSGAEQCSSSSSSHGSGCVGDTADAPHAAAITGKRSPSPAPQSLLPLGRRQLSPDRQQQPTAASDARARALALATFFSQHPGLGSPAALQQLLDQQQQLQRELHARGVSQDCALAALRDVKQQRDMLQQQVQDLREQLSGAVAAAAAQRAAMQQQEASSRRQLWPTAPGAAGPTSPPVMSAGCRSSGMGSGAASDSSNSPAAVCAATRRAVVGQPPSIVPLLEEPTGQQSGCAGLLGAVGGTLAASQAALDEQHEAVDQLLSLLQEPERPSELLSQLLDELPAASKAASALFARLQAAADAAAARAAAPQARHDRVTALEVLCARLQADACCLLSGLADAEARAAEAVGSVQSTVGMLTALEQHLRRLQGAETRARQAHARELAARSELQLCQEQLIALRLERSSLEERVRHFADRLGPGDEEPAAPGSSAAGSAAAAAAADGKLAAECAELRTLVVSLQRQLDGTHQREERLQLRNARLQERLSRMQVDNAVGVGVPREQADLLQQERLMTQELRVQLKVEQQAARRARRALADAEKSVREAAAGRVAAMHPGGDAAATSNADAVEDVGLRLELHEARQELSEWRAHADALEADLAVLRPAAESAHTLQRLLDEARAAAADAEARAEAQQQDADGARSRAARLEYELHDASKDSAALLSRFNEVSMELAHAKEAAADARLRLEHLTGPAGAAARARQLEASLTMASRRAEAAEARADAASRELHELGAKLAAAEDDVLALEGQVNILEQELATVAPR